MQKKARYTIHTNTSHYDYVHGCMYIVHNPTLYIVQCSHTFRYVNVLYMFLYMVSLESNKFNDCNGGKDYLYVV